MEITEDHIIPYLEGTLSPKETVAFEQLASTSPEFRKEISEIRFIWMSAENLKKQRLVDTNTHWERLSKKIANFSLRQRIWTISRNVAAIMFLPLLLTTVYFFKESSESTRLQSAEQIELKTASGLISKVTLPDGSEVWLNSGSKITYPAKFIDKRRTVRLEGEAYFKVTSDKTSRFDVLTSEGVRVSAYGTEFNVSAYRDDRRVEAVLVKGNIDVLKSDENKSFRLEAGEQAVWDPNAHQLSVSPANIYAQTAWKEGKMVFRRSGFDEIVKKLSRHFNVDIEIKGARLHEYEYSATFTTESLSEILSLLEKTAPIHCQIIEPQKQSDLTFAKRKVIISEQR